MKSLFTINSVLTSRNEFTLKPTGPTKLTVTSRFVNRFGMLSGRAWLAGVAFG